MAIAFTDSAGNLFNRAGKLFMLLKSLQALRLTTVPGYYDGIKAQYNSADQELADGLYAKRDSFRSTLDGLISSSAALFEATVIKMADTDATLTEKTKAGAMAEVITQMIGAGSIGTPDNDVDASTVTATVTAATANTGDAMVVASVKRPDGRTNELCYNETMEVICTTDSYSGGATAGSGEQWSVKGEPRAASNFSYNWPAGSGHSGSSTSIDANVDQSGNLLKNSGMDTFTVANTLDNWTYTVGAVTTNFLSEASTVYKTGGKALKLLGDVGGTLHSLNQKFTYGATAGDVSYALLPNTVYSFACKVGKGAGISAGVLVLSLCNSSGTILTDDAGNNLTTTIAHGAIAAAGSWTTFSGSFATPKVLTSQPQLKIHATTAVSDTHFLLIDNLSFKAMDATYKGGPLLSVHSGNTRSLKGDKYSVAVSNNKAGEIQLYTDMCLDMKALGLQLPSDTAGTETVGDALIL